MSKIEKELFDLYQVRYTKTTLLELKEWVDNQLKQGYTTFDYNLSWGYYDDIDRLELEAN